MNIFAIFCFSISLFLAASAQSFSDGLKGKLIANVFDENSRKPLYKAVVKIVETKQRAYTKKGTQGQAIVMNVEPGTYTVRVSYPGYSKYEIENVVVETDITPYLKVWLKQKPYTTCCFISLDPADSVSSDSSKLARDSIAKQSGSTNIPHSLQCNLRRFIRENANLFSEEREMQHTLKYIMDGEEKFIVEKSQLAVYPNPAFKSSHLQFIAERGDKVTIEVFDHSGNLVHRDMFEAATSGKQVKSIDVSSLSSGNYFVHVSGTGTFLRRGFSVLR